MKSVVAYSVVHLSLITVGLVACSREEPAQTVSWYRQHSEERKAMITRCSDDPGHLAQTPNCINASQAEGQESIGHWKDLPPLDLPLPKKQSDHSGDGSKAQP